MEQVDLHVVLHFGMFTFFFIYCGGEVGAFSVEAVCTTRMISYVALNYLTPSSSPYYFTVQRYIEVGRFSIVVNVQTLMLTNWKRFISLPNSRLVAHCYWSLLDNPHPSHPWLHCTKDIIFSTGQYHIWHNQKYNFASDPKFLSK